MADIQYVEIKLTSVRLYESFTSAFCLQEKLAEVYADVGVMLIKSKPLTDLMADDVMTFLLDIFADIFSLET